MKYIVIADHQEFKKGDIRECHPSIGEILKKQKLVKETSEPSDKEERKQKKKFRLKMFKWQ